MLLSQFLSKKIIIVFMLAIASGLPFSLIGSSFRTWLASDEIDIATIGLAGAFMLPYSFKFLWSPLFDAIKPLLPLGRRRGWLIPVQLMLAGLLFALANLSPASDIEIMAVICLLIGFLSASQDILIDAYRTEILHEDEYGYGAAVAAPGWRIGAIVISSGGLLFLADIYGWQFAYSILALLMFAFAVFSYFIPNPQHEIIRENRGIVQAYLLPLRDILRREYAISILLLIFLFKLCDAFAGQLTKPFYISLGFSLSEIATIISFFGLAATFTGGFLGALAVKKMGILRGLYLAAFLQMLSNIGFIVQDMVGYDALLAYFVIGFENICGGFGTALFISYISSLCSKEFTATQYALFSSLGSIGRDVFGIFGGFIAKYLGWSGFFGFSMLLAVPAILMLRVVSRRV